MSTHEVKCAKCNLPLQGPTDPKPNDRLSCSSCGEGDTLENVTREVSEYLAEKVKMKINSMFEEVSRKSQFIKVTGHYRPTFGHRFIVDYEP